MNVDVGVQIFNISYKFKGTFRCQFRAPKRTFKFVRNIKYLRICICVHGSYISPLLYIFINIFYKLCKYICRVFGATCTCLLECRSIKLNEKILYHFANNRVNVWSINYKTSLNWQNFINSQVFPLSQGSAYGNNSEYVTSANHWIEPFSL